MRVLYDSTQPPGRRVISLSLSESGASIDSAQTYLIATSRLLADGALGYFEIWDRKAITRDTGASLAEAVAAYSIASTPLDCGAQGRIRAR